MSTIHALHPHEPHLSAREVEAWAPYPMPPAGMPPIDIARERMRRNGQWQPWQMLGRRFSIGCVALEITQRCNLDCTYCYLSESSEALKDIPLEEVFRRIDMIVQWYGPGTDVQVTGGEPTLRKREELVAIVRRIKARGMRASLFTNGIKASRALLAELVAAGLDDVAFHVDTTQQRDGFKSEADLNRLREEYIARVSGLPLSVFFNTTVHAGNAAQVPALARFFVRHHRAVRLASFQVGAETGRGIASQTGALNGARVRALLSEGIDSALDFSAASAGHADCNGYAFALVIGEQAFDFFADPAFTQSVLSASASVRVDRARVGHSVLRIGGFLARHPAVAFGVLRRVLPFAWRHARALLAARGRVGKISFFVHDFMDASQLDRARCDACAFMVMTPEGPLSMCVHNAKRDQYLLVPARVESRGVVRFFDPSNGRFLERPPNRVAAVLTRKNSRGRARETVGRSHAEAAE